MNKKLEYLFLSFSLEKSQGFKEFLGFMEYLKMQLQFFIEF